MIVYLIRSDRVNGKEIFYYSLNLKLRTNRNFFGPGVVELLERISKTGSLNTSAKEMRISYNKAWRIIKKAEEELGKALIIKYVGGNKGGGSTLTCYGKEIMEKFLLFQRKVYKVTDEYFEEIFREELREKAILEDKK